MNNRFTFFGVSIGLMIVTSFATSGGSAEDLVHGNAALVYWQAFDGLPNLDSKTFNEAMTVAIDQELDEDVVKLVEGRSHIFKLMQRASRRVVSAIGESRSRKMVPKHFCHI